MADSQHSTTAPNEKPVPAWAPVTLASMTINGMQPFCSHGDGVDQRLSEAHALLLVVAHGYQFADTTDPQFYDEWGSLRHGITGEALSGIATLIALAMHHSDAAAEEARHAKA